MSDPLKESADAFSIAHSLKNHIASLRILTCLIEPALSGTTYEKYHRLMKRELDDLSELLLCLQDGSEGAGRFQKRVDLRNLLEELSALMSPRSELAGVTVELDLQEDLPDIPGDFLFLAEAFRNVWENAIEAMRNGGTLKVSARRSKTEKGNAVEVVFQDNGPGIPEFLLSRIATPFVTTKQHGMGLGLSTAKSIAAQHGGELLIASDGSGTTVTFKLPAEDVWRGKGGEE